MKIKANIYSEEIKNKLYPVASGECKVYVPIGEKGSNPADDYISFNFGKYRIHFNVNDFQDFCNKFLKLMYNRGRNNVSLLR